MQAKAKEAVFVGYSREKRGYRLLDSTTNKAFFSHTVVFYETKAGRILTNSPSPGIASEVSTSDYLGGAGADKNDVGPILDDM